MGKSRKLRTAPEPPPKRNSTENSATKAPSSTPATSADKVTVEATTIKNVQLNEVGDGSIVAIDKHVDESVGGGKAKTPTAVTREDRMKKLQLLRLRKNEATKLNRKDVVEEDKVSKLPKNWELKKRKVEWDMEMDAAKKAAEARGEDFDRTKYLNMSAREVESVMERKEKKDSLMNKGFGDYVTAGMRSYQRDVGNLKVNKQEYEERKARGGDAFYAQANDLTVGTLGDKHVDNVDRMVADLEKKIERRQKMSRRRAFDDEGDINYINERNMRFNQKADRYYASYTKEIKESLERGTAL
eukprot:CFRG6254T1